MLSLKQPRHPAARTERIPFPVYRATEHRQPPQLLYMLRALDNGPGVPLDPHCLLLGKFHPFTTGNRGELPSILDGGGYGRPKRELSLSDFDQPRLVLVLGGSHELYSVEG